MENLRSFETLIEIMKTLRAPNGCPWDREQTLDTLKPYLLEETYELLEAMDEDDSQNLKGELGDLLLQIVFQSEIKSETNDFNIYDVIEKLNEKMIRRHPHVFSDTEVKDSDEVMKNWEEIKKSEKEHLHRKSVLDGIPKNLPAIMKAHKIQKKAAKVGFDWNDLDGAIEKMEEELEEMRVAHKNNNKEEIMEELGDVMFSLVNVARLSDVDPYEALLKTIKKFETRFKYIEKNCDVEESGIELMEKLWQEAKKIEKGEKNEIR